MPEPKCQGAQDEHGRPLCEGPDVRRTVVQPLDGHPSFIADYCAECRADVPDNFMEIIYIGRLV